MRGKYSEVKELCYSLKKDNKKIKRTLVSGYSIGEGMYEEYTLHYNYSSLKTIRLFLIFQTCLDGTSVIVSVTVKITSVGYIILRSQVFVHNITQSRPQSRVPFGQRHGTKALAMSNEIPVLIG